jgi:hypothetical protein
MPATQNLSPEYHSIGTFDLSNNPQAMLQLNILGFALFAAFTWVFYTLLNVLRPADAQNGLAIGFSGISGLVQIVLATLLMMLGMIVLHEATHGICFWYFTRSMPKFALKLTYAYAAAPTWYLPKNQYLVTALAPLVGLSVLGVLLMLVVPREAFVALLFFLVTNASGAVGDLWVVGWLLRQPQDCYANDRGDAVTVYVR